MRTAKKSVAKQPPTTKWLAGKKVAVKKAATKRVNSLRIFRDTSGRVVKMPPLSLGTHVPRDRLETAVEEVLNAEYR
ncbi:MAG: hypothetical protein ACREYF_17415 [Gammaproteobacteria bacterium]